MPEPAPYNALLASVQQVARCGVDALKQLGRELKVRTLAGLPVCTPMFARRSHDWHLAQCTSCAWKHDMISLWQRSCIVVLLSPACLHTDVMPGLHPARNAAP